MYQASALALKDANLIITLLVICVASTITAITYIVLVGYNYFPCPNFLDSRIAL